MPNPAMDRLGSNSSDKQTQDAISSEIELCMSEPIPPDVNVTEAGKKKWCAGKAYGMARSKTGKSLDYGR